MNYNTLINELGKISLIPVIKICKIEDALPIAENLLEGGINNAEITLRSDCAIEAIYKIKENFKELIVGVGTVVNTKQIDEIIDAKPDFLVSPGLNPKTVKYAKEKNIPIFAGVETAGEIEKAMELDLEIVKFFPAEQIGGVKKIKALSAPYFNMKFIPTGGISLSNLEDYLQVKNIVACGGSFFVNQKLIDEKNYSHIVENCKKAIEIKKHIRN